MFFASPRIPVNANSLWIARRFGLARRAFAIRPILAKTIVLGCILFASPAVTAEQVDVATPVRGLIELPIVVAMRNRYFATEGLEIRKIQIEPEVAVKALVAEQVDFSLAWDASLGAAISGAPIKLVAATAARPLHVLMSRPEIRSGKDLKGKTLGVDELFGTTDYLSRVAMRYLGVDPDKDVNIVETGSSALRFIELRAGSIHAAVIDAATAARAEEEGFKRLVHLGDIIDLPVFGVAVTAKKLAARREQVKKFIRATLRGARFAKQNRTDSVRIIQSYLKITPSQAAKAYVTAVGAFTDDGFVSERALALSVRRIREKDQIAAGADLAKVVDRTLLREIMADRRKIPSWLKQYDL
jgi:NitT/TauT family transport system substrate-binding protein